MSLENTFGITRKKYVIRSVKEFAAVDSFNQIVKFPKNSMTQKQRKLLKEMEGYGYRVWMKVKSSK